MMMVSSANFVNILFHTVFVWSMSLIFMNIFLIIKKNLPLLQEQSYGEWLQYLI